MTPEPPPPQVRWQPVAPTPSESPAQPARQSPIGSGPVFVPVPGSAIPAAAPTWRPVLSAEGTAAAEGAGPAEAARGPVWKPVPPGEETLVAPAPGPGSQPLGPPLTLAEAEERRQDLPPPPDSYPPLLRLGQLPVATFLEDGYAKLDFQQVSPGTGGVGGGTGNQNYGFRADLSVNSKLLISAFYTFADDPLFARISVRPTQPENLWTVAGGALRARLGGGSTWAIGAEGSIEVFTVGSGGCYSAGCSGTSDNMFNTSGQKVFSRNWIGSFSLPLSWNPVPRWQLSLVPGVSFLPATQAGGTFYGTNLTVGVGSSYRIGDQLNLFSSAVFPLGPGSNAFNSNLSFYRVPVVSVGANYAVNPRIALEAAVTNGYGLTPATAVLALPSAPSEPLLSGRFVWTAGAPDSPRVRFNRRLRSLSLGGVSVSTAVLPPDGTTQLWANGDSLGNLFAMAGYSVSNDFQFELSGGSFGGAGATANGVAAGSAATFLNTYQGPGNRNIRFGGKAMVLRPSQGLPLWAAGRITVGRNFQSSSYQGYLFFETVNTWEATPWLAFNLNPKLAWSGLGTPWGVGL
ncbi:MAG: hypothetical protein FJ051_04575, partial [Cyanobacteria bacterium M_surface_9_m1_291]|nr:hypothetical protein [Cyanobacteria bacterium M_surface_9_m1_291]